MMKKNLFLSTVVALAMTAVCGTLTSCGDDDDPTPQPTKTIKSGKFNYSVIVNKELTDWANVSITITPSVGNATTTTLTAANARTANNLLDEELLYLDPIVTTLSGNPGDYYVYTIAVNLPQFPATVKAEYQATIKEGNNLTADSRVNVTIVSGYGLYTNTNQSFAGTSLAVSGLGVKGDKLADYLSQQLPSLKSTYTFSVVNGSLVVK